MIWHSLSSTAADVDETQDLTVETERDDESTEQESAIPVVSSTPDQELEPQNKTHSTSSDPPHTTPDDTTQQNWPNTILLVKV